MTDKLHVPETACASCPYRRSVPSGVWDRTEYEKLRALDSRAPGEVAKMPDGTLTVLPVMGTFACHQQHTTGVDTLCRGWLSVERDSIGVRLLLLDDRLNVDDIPEEDEGGTYYATGTEACEAGLKDIEKPSRAARAVMGNLLGKGIGENEDE